MTRGSQCARFEVRTVVGREVISNLLLLVCYKGGVHCGIIQQYTTDSSVVRYLSFGWDRYDSLFITEVILNLTISQGIVVVDNVMLITEVLYYLIYNWIDSTSI